MEGFEDMIITVIALIIIISISDISNVNMTVAFIFLAILQEDNNVLLLTLTNPHRR